MRILVDTGAYDCANIGDVAMMQVTVSRLRACWPLAWIGVITNNPVGLRKLCPDAIPVSAKGRNCWLVDRNLLGRYHKHLPSFVSEGLDNSKRLLRRSFPSTLAYLMEKRLKLSGNGVSDFKAFREALLGANVVVACGMGGLTDHCRVASLSLLELLEAASRHGLPTAMFSQGIGPMTDPQVRSLASKVLPRIDLLAIRETRTAVPLLKSLGVSEDRLIATGDDAIELGYAGRSSVIGEAIGVNLRVARSAAVDSHFIDRVRLAVHAAAQSHNARLIPLPIGNGRASNDRETLKHVLAGLDGAVPDNDVLDTPASIIKQVGLCRVVLTGAYHAAVFALSQGIPAVCLAKSPYFVNKFLGLAEQFKPGCEVVMLDSPNFEDEILDAMDRLWRLAHELRPRLQEIAALKIGASRQAYKRFAEVVAQRFEPVPPQVLETTSTRSVRPALMKVND